MKKHVEIKTIEHKGINVTVRVDYDRGTASLVERGNMNPDEQAYLIKAWHFGDRGLEHINSWLNILEAMSVAVKECKKDLEAKLAEDSAFKEKMTDKMVVMIDELAKSYKKKSVKKSSVKPLKK